MGSSIGVYGSIGRENNNGHPLYAPVTTYRLDGGKPESFTHDPQRGIIYRQLFYQADNLEEGPGKEHTLVIENTLPNRNMVWLDYLQYVSSSERAPPPQPYPHDHVSQPQPVCLGKGWFFGSFLMGCGFGIVMFVFLVLITARGIRAKKLALALRDREAAVELVDGQETRHTRRSGSRHYASGDAEAEVGLLSAEDDEASSTSTSQDTHGCQPRIKRAAPVEGASLLDIPPMSSRGAATSQTDAPPAYTTTGPLD
ncbi:hypothetical protein H0H93_014802 [Arthromyces matolae]|nr:hypothetical protein H0H93_014802 [Arthromyces matolae]